MFSVVILIIWYTWNWRGKKKAVEMLLKSECLQIQGKGGASIKVLVLTPKSLFDVSLLSLKQLHTTVYVVCISMIY